MAELSDLYNAIVLEKPLIFDNLDLSYTDIKALPPNLSVGSDLDLSFSGIEELPSGLSVGGDLDLRGTDITKLPPDLSVGGDLYLGDDTYIREVPSSVRVGGRVFGKQNTADSTSATKRVWTP